MSSIPAGIAAQQALTQQAIALSVLKQAADADKAIANMLQNAVESVPVSQARGSSVNISA